MKPLRTRIQEETKKKAVPQYVIEKDYALSHILVGIAKHKELSKSLVFKGGTALKKIYFGDYRFSEDLDFSGINCSKGDDLEKQLNEVISITLNQLKTYGPFEIHFRRNPENSPHPTGQEAFLANIQFPWHPNPQCRIKIEVTQDEPVLKKPPYKKILHGYDEKINHKIACYQIEEIIAEKMRALLQTHKKIVTKDWSRPRPRDYYDLWRILKSNLNSGNKNEILKILKEKCKVREISFSKLDDFFTNELIKDTLKSWKGSLGHLMTDLPDCDVVLKETRVLFEDMFK